MYQSILYVHHLGDCHTALPITDWTDCNQTGLCWKHLSTQLWTRIFTTTSTFSYHMTSHGYIHSIHHLSLFTNYVYSILHYLSFDGITYIRTLTFFLIAFTSIIFSFCIIPFLIWTNHLTWGKTETAIMYQSICILYHNGSDWDIRFNQNQSHCHCQHSNEWYSFMQKPEPDSKWTCDIAWTTPFFLQLHALFTVKHDITVPS